MRGGLLMAFGCLGLAGCVPEPGAYPGAPYAGGIGGPAYAQPYGYAAPGPSYPVPAYGYAEPGFGPAYGGGVVVVPRVGPWPGGRFDRDRSERERFERDRFERERGGERGARPAGLPFAAPSQGPPGRPPPPAPQPGGGRAGGPPPPPAAPAAAAPRPHGPGDPRRPGERG